MIWFVIYMFALYIALSFPAVNAMITWSPSESKQSLIKSQHDRFLFAALWPVLLNLGLLAIVAGICLSLVFALIRALLYLPSLVLAPAWDWVYFKMYPETEEEMEVL